MPMDTRAECRIATISSGISSTVDEAVALIKPHALGTSLAHTRVDEQSLSGVWSGSPTASASQRRSLLRVLLSLRCVPSHLDGQQSLRAHSPCHAAAVTTVRRRVASVCDVWWDVVGPPGIEPGTP